MKKSILNLGKALNKAEQKSINGGAKETGSTCWIQEDCEPGQACTSTLSMDDFGLQVVQKPGYCVTLIVD